MEPTEDMKHRRDDFAQFIYNLLAKEAGVKGATAGFIERKLMIRLKNTGLLSDEAQAVFGECEGRWVPGDK